MAAGNGGNVTIALITVALLGVAVAIAVPLLVVSDPPPPTATRAEEPMAATGLTPEKPERLPVPRGIKGLTFGSTIEEVVTALPGAEWDDHPFINIYDDLDEPQPPGPLRQCDTTIGTQEATCDLFFAVDDRLSAIACRVHVGGDSEVYTAVENAIRSTLTGNHGLPHRHWDRDGPIGIIRDSGWVWEDDHARLELRSTMSGLTLINTSRAHQALSNKRKLDATRAAEENARREESDRQRRLEEIEKSHNAFDRDL